MGDQYIELIVFAGVAAFLAYRLWMLLGRRPGAEPPPQIQRPQAERSPLRQPPRQPNTPPAAVVSLTNRLRPAPAAPAATPLQAGFDAIRAADPAFTP